MNKILLIIFAIIILSGVAFTFILKPGYYFTSCTCTTKFFLIKPTYDCARVCPKEITINNSQTTTPQTQPANVSEQKEISTDKEVSKIEKDTPIFLTKCNAGMTIPKDATYKVTAGGWAVDIQLSNNVNVSMCTGCQPTELFQMCGPSYGMSGEGICESEKVNLGGIEMQKHIYKNKSAGMAFISGNISGDQKGSLFMGITTSNNKNITKDEETLIDKLIKSISFK
jgi:hypothetical protein